MSEQDKPKFWNRFTVKQIVLAATVLVAVIFTTICAVYTFNRTDGLPTNPTTHKPPTPITPASPSNGTKSQKSVPSPSFYEKFNPDATPQFVGLLNPSISCYVNSSIQLLYHNPVYRKLLKKLVMESPSEYIGKEAHTRMQALAGFFHQMDSSRKGVALKAKSQELLPANMTEENGQQDAQEALQEILYGVLDDSIALKTSENGFYVYPNGIKEARDPIKEIRNIIQLEIPESEKRVLTKKWTFNELLKKAFEQETVNVDGQYDIVRNISFEHLPQTLIIQIKRFGCDSLTKQTWKINDTIPTPEEFEMTQADGKVVKYRLQAFIKHIEWVHGGHYIAYVRNKDSKFVCLNDSSISILEQDQFDDAKDNAYIYSYISVNEK